MVVNFNRDNVLSGFTWEDLNDEVFRLEAFGIRLHWLKLYVGYQLFNLDNVGAQVSILLDQTRSLRGSKLVSDMNHQAMQLSFGYILDTWLPHPWQVSAAHHPLIS